VNAGCGEKDRIKKLIRLLAAEPQGASLEVANACAKRAAFFIRVKVL
jgi:hypothetical protein